MQRTSLVLTFIAGICCQLSGCFFTRDLWKPDHPDTCQYDFPAKVISAEWTANHSELRLAIQRPSLSDEAMTIDGKKPSREHPLPEDPDVQQRLSGMSLAWDAYQPFNSDDHRAKALTDLEENGVLIQPLNVTGVITIAPPAADAGNLTITWSLPGLVTLAGGAEENDVPQKEVSWPHSQVIWTLEQGVRWSLQKQERIHIVLLGWGSSRETMTQDWAALKPAVTMANARNSSSEIRKLVPDGTRLFFTTGREKSRAVYQIDLFCALLASRVQTSSLTMTQVRPATTKAEHAHDLTNQCHFGIRISTPRHHQYDLGMTCCRVVMTPFAVVGDAVIIITAPVWISLGVSGLTSITTSSPGYMRF